MAIGDLISPGKRAEINALATRVNQLETENRRHVETINEMYSMLTKAKEVLGDKIARESLQNVTQVLESMQSKSYMQYFVVKHIMHSGKANTAYCKIVKAKCLKVGVSYYGWDKEKNHFIGLQDSFPYNAFNEKALENPLGGLSLRFKMALVDFILDQRSYLARTGGIKYKR
jgi:uncharacterized coiled-coil protein SlyX